MKTSYQTLKINISDSGILQITLNRPDKLNVLSSELLTDLDHIFKKATTTPTVKAILLTGEGKAFCAGADISRLAELDGHAGMSFSLQGQAIFRHLETMGKPSIAAINGYAMGGGCELAMAASIRIASTAAVFAQPEVKLGVIPGYGGTQRLPRLIGKGRALEMCLTGRSIKAEEALAFGLISEMTEPNELISRAEHILSGILAMGPLAIKKVLEVIDKGYDQALPEALLLEAREFAYTCSTSDKKEGVNAFLEKRVATFKGV
jgi:enoyl-CoA hydratase